MQEGLHITPHRALRITVLSVVLILIGGPSGLLLARSQAASETPSTQADVKLPGKGSVWVLDSNNAGVAPAQLFRTPIVLNRHVARNIAGGVAGSVFYRPVLSVELQGPRSETRISFPNPILFVRSSGAFESTEDLRPGTDASKTLSDLVLVRLESRKNKRVESSISYNGFGTGAKRKMKTIMLRRETTQDGWEKLTPSEALEQGEYALVALPLSASFYAETAYDFGIDPAPAHN